MAVTKLFTRLFDAVQNDEDSLVKQVQNDLNTADSKGSLETDQLKYTKTPEGVIQVVDSQNNETTNVTPTKDGYKLDSDGQSFLLPELNKKLDDLDNKVNLIGEAISQATGGEESNGENQTPEEKNDGEGSESSKTGEKETKTESVVQRGVKVIINLDGKLQTAIVMDNPLEDTVKVRIPGLQNQVVDIPLNQVSIPTAAEAEQIEGAPQRQNSRFMTFSKKTTFSEGKFEPKVKKSKTPTFSCGKSEDPFSSFKVKKCKGFSAGDDKFVIVKVDQNNKLVKVIAKRDSLELCKEYINNKPELLKGIADTSVDIWKESYYNSHR